MNPILVLVFTSAFGTILPLLIRGRDRNEIYDNLTLHLMMISPIMAISIICVDAIVSSFIVSIPLGTVNLPISILISLILVEIIYWVSNKFYDYLSRQGKIQNMKNRPVKSREWEYIRATGLESNLYLAIIFFNVSLIFIIVMLVFYIPFCGNIFLNIIEETACFSY